MKIIMVISITLIKIRSFFILRQNEKTFINNIEEFNDTRYQMIKIKKTIYK